MSNDSLNLISAELKRWFGSASEIAREWVDFDNEARNLLHIMGESADSGDTHRGPLDSASPTRTLIDCPDCGKSVSEYFSRRVEDCNDEVFSSFRCGYCGFRVTVCASTKERASGLREKLFRALAPERPSEISGDAEALIMLRKLKTFLIMNASLKLGDLGHKMNQWQKRIDEFLTKRASGEIGYAAPDASERNDAGSTPASPTTPEREEREIPVITREECHLKDMLVRYFADKEFEEVDFTILMDVIRPFLSKPQKREVVTSETLQNLRECKRMFEYACNSYLAPDQIQIIAQRVLDERNKPEIEGGQS